VDYSSQLNDRSAIAGLKADLDRIRALDKNLRAFNIFEVLRVQRRELQHSNFLAYLLDPSAGHGLGAAFLERFLAGVVDQHPNEARMSITKADLEHSFVVREWENKDILTRNIRLPLVCVIEN
jgi:PD-(D/E)XK nuclease superfamily